jgi:hypothetical protein
MSSHRNIAETILRQSETLPVSVPVALQGDSNIASAIVSDTLIATGNSENALAGFNSGLAVCEYCGFSHDILAGCKFNHGPVVSSPVTLDFIQREDDGTYLMVYSDGNSEYVTSEFHNSEDMFILSDGTLIDTYVAPTLPSGRKVKVDSEHSEYSDWNIRRMILTNRSRKIRESLSDLTATVDTDSQILVSFRVTSVRGIRLITSELSAGHGYISASHFVASKFLASVPELSASDLSSFKNRVKRSGTVSTSPASGEQVSMTGLAAITKVQFLELFASMSDEDKVALRAKLMA